ncbi:D-glucuronyl C5-epimerase family protein [Kyrpidia sp.]|uniref:D-glucuronyl C5-epimerase family protein n=1 Tax=Kyrpidia sp. TaxID=2073077 RepID=UPI002585C020|nr:D-glucuronyl C5-epimerase family protein [Kyrpidia sp.]MCL6576101.1 D-glucuronyl C5-epimerase family protein [Kyrpidia sp.]
MVRVGDTTIRNPVTIAQYGLQEYSYYLVERTDESLRNAIRSANWLVENQDMQTGKWYYGFDFAVAGMDVTLKAPWSSAMAQGQAMSLLTRVYRVTKDRRYLDAALRAMHPLHESVSDGGLTADFFGHPFYEEYPTSPPSYTLNGFMFTLIGLYDLPAVAPASGASKLFEDGINTLTFALPFYDMGNTSAYHLGHLSRPPRKIHSSPDYHLEHITLLRALSSITGDPIITFYRDLWSSYVENR